MTEQLVRPDPISGFPEWLPEVRLVEQHWLDKIRQIFESYGFCSIETPSVERLDVLQSKGETSQEVYTLQRLQADAKDQTDASLGLHFDLTVPFARYVAANAGRLVFPFKRYQIQRVWRGERPQEGRYREFTQCDIDVIGQDNVPLHFDSELLRIVVEVLTALDLPAWTVNVNNRKVLQGFYEGLGIHDTMAVIRVVDKIDKIGPDAVSDLLASDVGLTADQVSATRSLALIRGTDSTVIDEIRALGVKSDLLEEGLTELGQLLDSFADLPAGTVTADLSIARGLDYYTGTVYEAKFLDWPGYGSISAGGRYENLTGSFTRKKLPGIGLSIGLTRIFAKLVAEGLIQTGPSSPTDVLVVVPSDDRRIDAQSAAATLRGRGLNVELYHQADKIAKQLKYASRKQIPFVWFPPFEDGRDHEVKDMASGEQSVADPAAWSRA
ncbi:histidine--tRNA ligase [Promicromonospora aerolata]|uniref:Histidine--tRNA ligase n=1 Tax=Promicromonospora aerolata TaxID=195749 RepID=A0ABW4VG35_9MICO